MADENEMIPTVPIVVSTGFFNREAMMYALGDIRFSKPKSLKAMVYTVVLLLVYSLPMSLWVVGLSRTFSNIIFAFIVFGPAIIIGNIAVRPIFNGKSMIKYFASYIKYLSHPKLFCDLFPYEPVDTVETDISMWISD
jgi:hypothetical protein